MKTPFYVNVVMVTRELCLVARSQRRFENFRRTQCESVNKSKILTQRNVGVSGQKNHYFIWGSYSFSKVHRYHNTMTSIAPIVKWAQRSSATDAAKNVIYLTIEIVDAKNTKLDLTATHLKLAADSSDNNSHYDLNIEFYDEIDTENSHKNTENGSHIYFVLRKKTAKEEFWPRLTKEKLKYHYIRTDFDKWVDEDEQDEQPEPEDDMSNMMNLGGGPGGPGGLGGMGGPGGIDFSQLMQGAGGAGGPGNFDISALASQLGQAGGAKGEDLDFEDDDEDDDDAEEEEAVEEVK
ncbi:HSP20-like chaperone [Scheffersomyces xylosifermentans]|uniref:HSP20-like chaperone n=1 Tax=Scheffersomyces xylosifermentans TaxID=1304137 RepID=UPI00315CB01B